jgi:hypothetical protein
MQSNKLNQALEMVGVLVISVIPLFIVGIFLYGLIALVAPSPSCAEEFIGRASSNPYAAGSCANEFSACGNPFSPVSPRNPFGPYGNPYSPYSANNPFATDTPSIYGHADE